MKTVVVPTEPTQAMLQAAWDILASPQGEAVRLIWKAMLAAAQQEDQRESNSNPSPGAGQSKQGLTESHSGAPTYLKERG